MKRRFFSLIELLIVISIIAILASLLLPALQHSRKRSRQMQCVGNFRQLALGYLSYCGENRDFTPMQEDNAYDGTWRLRLSVLLLGKTNYIDAGLMRCSEYQEACAQRGYTDYDTPAGSWKKTVFYTGNLNFYGHKIVTIRQPSRTGIIMDGSFLAGKHSTSNLTYLQAGWRHARDATIFSYLDGHVRSIGNTGDDSLIKDEFKLK